MNILQTSAYSNAPVIKLLLFKSHAFPVISSKLSMYLNVPIMGTVKRHFSLVWQQAHLVAIHTPFCLQPA